MESTATTKNMTSIEIKVRVIPERAERGRRLMGSGMSLSPGHSAVDDLVAERDQEG
jgi:hypothetical protein